MFLAVSHSPLEMAKFPPGGGDSHQVGDHCSRPYRPTLSDPKWAQLREGTKAYLINGMYG